MTPFIEIQPSQVTPELKALFDPHMPTAIRCQAVLGGGNAGRIFTDCVDKPSMAFVWERDDGTLYRGGEKDWQVLHELVALLRQDGIVALGYRQGDPDVEHFPPDPDAGAECVELKRPVGGSDLTPFLELPEDFEVHRMGRTLLEKSPRLDETLHRYGSLDTYLETGLNVCILHGDESVGEAGADMDVGGVREVGVVTEHAYRGGRGFGTMLTAHLLKWCDELGCSTYWDCVKLNLPSLYIARKLGFVDEKSYRRLAWFPPRGEIKISRSDATQV